MKQTTNKKQFVFSLILLSLFMTVGVCSGYEKNKEHNYKGLTTDDKTFKLTLKPDATTSYDMTIATSIEASCNSYIISLYFNHQPLYSSFNVSENGIVASGQYDIANDSWNGGVSIEKCGKTNSRSWSANRIKPVISAVPSTIAISTSPPHSNSVKVEIGNSGEDLLYVYDIQLKGDTKNFSIQENTCTPYRPIAIPGTTIHPGFFCSFDLFFSPQVKGSYTSDITIYSHDPDTPILKIPVIGSTRNPYIPGTLLLLTD